MMQAPGHEDAGARRMTGESRRAPESRVAVVPVPELVAIVAQGLNQGGGKEGYDRAFSALREMESRLARFAALDCTCVTAHEPGCPMDKHLSSVAAPTRPTPLSERISEELSRFPYDANRHEPIRPTPEEET